MAAISRAAAENGLGLCRDITDGGTDRDMSGHGATYRARPPRAALQRALGRILTINNVRAAGGRELPFALVGHAGKEADMPAFKVIGLWAHVSRNIRLCSASTFSRSVRSPGESRTASSSTIVAP